MRIQSIVIFFVFFQQLAAQEVHTYLDLQMHPTMHVPYGFFGKGFTSIDSAKANKLTHKHQLKNVNHLEFWKQNPGARMITVGYLTREGVRSTKQAKACILEQISYVEKFVSNNSEHFVIANNPKEARSYYHHTNKTIILQSIEGAKHLITSQEEADFWAAKGIAFITLMHLVDSHLGSAAIRPGLATKIINWKGWLRKTENRGGLTDLGQKSIVWLAGAGILTDLTHMSDKSRTEALALMKEKRIPPISTHDAFKPIQNHPRGWLPEDITKLYDLGGFFSLPISGIALQLYKPFPEYKTRVAALEQYCDGSIDSYQFTYESVKEIVENHAIVNYALSDFNHLADTLKTQYSIGFQTDFNGWLNHSKPRYGKSGCYAAEAGHQHGQIELEGMPHPGYLESHWQFLEKEGVDLMPVKRNAEHFLSLWERFIAEKERFR